MRLPLAINAVDLTALALPTKRPKIGQWNGTCADARPHRDAARSQGRQPPRVARRRAGRARWMARSRPQRQAAVDGVSRLLPLRSARAARSPSAAACPRSGAGAAKAAASGGARARNGAPTLLLWAPTRCSAALAPTTAAAAASRAHWAAPARRALTRGARAARAAGKLRQQRAMLPRPLSWTERPGPRPAPRSGTGAGVLLARTRTRRWRGRPRPRTAARF